MIIDSVLVDEIPNNCFVCKFSDRNIWGNKWICILTEEFISDAVDMGVKDHNCPISIYKKSIYYHDHLLAMDKLKARITELETELNLLKQERDFDRAVYKAQHPDEVQS